MTQMNIVLFVVFVLFSLGVVTSQHQARKLYSELDQLRATEKKYLAELNLLRLEQSTKSMHSKVEEHAKKELGMKVPESKQVQVINLREDE